MESGNRGGERKRGREGERERGREWGEGEEERGGEREREGGREGGWRGRITHSPTKILSFNLLKPKNCVLYYYIQTMFSNL